MTAGLKILVVGGGMYVTGRGTETSGTLVPALLEGVKHGLVSEVAIVTTQAGSALEACRKSASIARQMGVDCSFAAFPKEGECTNAYLQAAKAFQPDAVLVSVPDHLHASVSIPLIEKGLHCLVVKPMASSLEEAQAMVASAEKNQVVAQVEFHKRYDESNLLLYDAVQSRKLGDLLYAVIEYSQQKRIPRDVFRSWVAKTSVFQYLGVHYVDLLYFVTGFLPRRVTAWGQKSHLYNLGIDTWDAMQVVIEWEDFQSSTKVGMVSTHITNWIDPDETSSISDQKINLVGTLGRFQADQKHRGVQTVTDSQGVKDVNPYFSSSWIDPQTGKIKFHGYGIQSVLQFLRDVHWVKYHNGNLEELITSRPSFQSGLISTAVIDAAHQSLLIHQSSPVEIHCEKN
jgi:predicted dehydrogenase